MQTFIAGYCEISLIKSASERRNHFEPETDGYYNRKANTSSANTIGNDTGRTGWEIECYPAGAIELDIACGNGNYSSYLAQRGASVVAFDYSKKMIELAKRRRSQYAKQIEFCVADATNRESLLGLKRNRAFTKAVSNMAIMDITDIEPLFMAVYELLEENGIFVFATQHPCFITLTEKYMTPHSYYGIAIEGQPEEQIYYHRSIQDIFNLCFRAGFVIDGFYEECFKNNKEIPMVMIVRLKKVKRDSLK